jgi:hypothetical protein
LAAIAEKYGYEFKDNEKAEYTTLLAATCNAMQFVSEMDGPFNTISIYNLKHALTLHRLPARTELGIDATRKHVSFHSLS